MELNRMTPTETLARLADAATPGPWEWDGDVWDYDPSNEAPWLVGPNDGTIITGEVKASKANAEFIAAANPSAIKSLLARIEALEREVALRDRALDAAKKSLAGIRQLSLGPDKGSVAWQAECASVTAQFGINKINTILGGENTPHDLPR